ncbi:MAG: haloacid dehalogenase [Cycloclasticus sp. symbiont of Poecilosclerida sp. M]|nr:MAG: haloacid dehalogenase [Cycloclasticus sp. symbiont of Poecilosclerida sp. M]
MALTSAEDCIQAVLFDLDGTLVDTAPDLANALNHVLNQENQNSLPYPTIRPMVSNGANGLLKLAFGDALSVEKHEQLKADLISFYKQNIAVESALFDGMADILKELEEREISWGIVTNKPKHLTGPLLESLNLDKRAHCVVSGDEVARSKPHPESIYLACQLLQVPATKSVYIGDAERDIIAGQRAGCRTVACEFGYIPTTDNINTWGADEIVATPVKLKLSLEQMI